jgi:hypothetical protein
MGGAPPFGGGSQGTGGGFGGDRVDTAVVRYLEAH